DLECSQGHGGRFEPIPTSIATTRPCVNIRCLASGDRTVPVDGGPARDLRASAITACQRDSSPAFSPPTTGLTLARRLPRRENSSLFRRKKTSPLCRRIGARQH